MLKEHAHSKKSFDILDGAFKKLKVSHNDLCLENKELKETNEELNTSFNDVKKEHTKKPLKPTIHLRARYKPYQALGSSQAKSRRRLINNLVSLQVTKKNQWKKSLMNKSTL